METVNCPTCARPNDLGNKFCGYCGKALPNLSAEAAADEEQPCYKHKKEMTRLSCGRCERPICTKCAVIGPAGVRCRECSRHKVAVRPAAVAHEFKYGISSLFRGGSYNIYILILIAGLVLSFSRGCMSEPEPVPEQDFPQESSQTAP